MARISIKKNFVDGEKLFAQQLNNNFETIEKGINDGNKIVWQDGTEVKFKRYMTNDIDSLPILDGSIIYDTEKGRHYIDYAGKRIQVGSAGKEVVVQEEQPTEEDNKLWIDSDIVNTMGTEISDAASDSRVIGYSANYLNDRIVKVSAIKPTSDEKVWIQKGKNLYNKKEDTIGYLNEDGSIYTESTYRTSAYISISPNTTYFKTATESVRAKYYDKNKKPLTDSYNDLGGSGAFAFTTPSDAYYLRVSMLETYSDTLQIEIGDVATDYEEYIPVKIYTKNDNGGYEEIYNEEIYKEHYSTEEQVIGTWLGKPLYRKVITGYNITDAQNQTIGVPANIETLVNLTGFAKWSNNFYDIKSAGYIFVLSTSANVITMSRTNWVTGLQGYVGTFIVEYTKTTD